MFKTYEIDLDLEKELYTPVNLLFDVSRNDFDSVELLFNISQDGAALDLSGKTIELAIKKPSGLTVYQAAEITEATAGKAALILKLQAYIEYGIHTAELYIRDNVSLAVTTPFYYSSRSAIMETEEIESINDWSALQQALFSYDLKPILIDGVPQNLIPEYVGQMAFDTLGKRVFIANDLTAESWQLIGAGEGGGGGVISWIDILGKPATFTPEAHSHLIADVTGLQLALDSKADIGEGGGAPADHTHLIADVTGLQLALDSKVDDTQLTGLAPANHSHTFAEITGKPATYPAATHSHTFAEITGKPATYPAEAHTHTTANITDFAAGVAGAIPTEYLTQTEGDTRYSIKGSEGGTVQPAEWGTITGLLSSQTDLQTALNDKADNADLTGLAPAGHSHTFAEITGKPATYPADAHSHTFDAITGKPATYPAEAHTHTAANITDFGTAVAGAIPAGYLTETEGNVLYMAANATPTPAAHTHTTANITDFAAGVAGAIPAEYLTETEGDLRYKAIGATVEAHTHTIGDITNLSTTLDGKTDKNYVDTADNNIINTILNDHKIWSGTQFAYNAIGTYDPKTIYFISG